TTGGKSIYLFQPEGISALLRETLTYRSALYTVSYTSTADSDFGRKYIPLELEAVYVKRSGRDELGYYPPLK
ncbi:MAG: hypothetical protein GY756_11845, partial [bacterium]|nr:hypothetical protein [bacterium]